MPNFNTTDRPIRQDNYPATVATSDDPRPDSSAVGYSPAVTNDWAGGADPGHADAALDQLAQRLSSAEGSLVTDHGGLTGLGDDDHGQYHNDARADARYYAKTLLDGGQLDNRYFRKDEHVQQSGGAGDAAKPIQLDVDGHVDGSMINNADIDHDNIANAGSNTHAQIDTHIAASNPHSGSGDTSGPASSTDNAVARYDGTGGKTLQNSGVTISDTNVLSGVTQLDVDNIRVDGNTISSTDTDGDINLTPDGAGQVVVGNAGDIELGDATLRKIQPNSTEKMDLGSSTKRFNEVHFVTLKPKTAPTYSESNVTLDRAYNANSTTVAELADVLGTLISDLRALGLVT